MIGVRACVWERSLLCAFQMSACKDLYIWSVFLIVSDILLPDIPLKSLSFFFSSKLLVNPHWNSGYPWDCFCSISLTDFLAGIDTFLTAETWVEDLQGEGCSWHKGNKGYLEGWQRALTFLIVWGQREMGITSSEVLILLFCCAVRRKAPEVLLLLVLIPYDPL